MKTARKLDIVHAYVMATKGVVPTDVGNLLSSMRELIGDVSEADVREAIRWALRPSSLPFPHAKPEPKQAPRPPGLRLVQ